MSLEVEIKLWAPSGLAQMRKRIRGLEFKLTKRRVFEQNTLFDTADLKLRGNDTMIRVRRAGKVGVLTFKGPSQPGPHKSREEIETKLDDTEAMELILARLGHHPVFRYEKFREEYERPGRHGAITLDETPIGNFLELEGTPKWIDRTAQQLGFSPADYITPSYGNLYLAYCREHGITPSDMTFEREP